VEDFERFAALSFDCYGTLIDWETGIATALAPWAGRAGLDLGPEDLIAGFARHETVVQSEHQGWLYPEILAETMRRMAADVGAGVSETEARAFGRSVGQWPAFSDTAAALARLQARYKLVILSNVDRVSFRQSNDRLGVELDLVVTAEDVGAYKPSPANFDALLDGAASIGVGRADLLHVAESLYHDHVPAAAIGLASVWIHRRHGRIGPGATAAPDRPVEPHWRFPSMAAFADAAIPAG
jgi:2-haloalkanoic acid dehalogenase type II